MRRDTFILCHKARHGHLGSAFSMVDVLVALYHNFLRVDPKHPDDPKRDRFILSKGHGCESLYVALAHKGFFSEKDLNTFLKDGTIFAGHTNHAVPGVELSTGSLGHGLPVAVGMAYAAKLSGGTYRMVVMLSDGECDEGAVWEAALAARQHKLDNLLAIVDYNKIQGFGRTKDVLDLEPFAQKWEAFGWNVKEIDGHNMIEIMETLKKIPFEAGKPSVILAHTVKGKGVSFMEDTIDWHYWTPTDEHLAQAMTELA